MYSVLHIKRGAGVGHYTEPIYWEESHVYRITSDNVLVREHRSKAAHGSYSTGTVAEQALSLLTTHHVEN